MAAINYRTANVEGLEIFYREAGPKDAPTLLLLHGFPSAGHMFRDLIPRLADRYHLVREAQRAELGMGGTHVAGL